MDNTAQVKKIQEIIGNISNEVTGLLEINDIITRLESDNQELRTNNIRLKRENDSLKAYKTNGGISEFLTDLKNQNNSSFGLINQSRLNEEAIFDAINKFNKSCPYCGKDLYEGNIRRKIEIDHFFPISRGGQDFPWNLLPSCKECNRQKKNKMPYEFLPHEKYVECQAYLNDVQKRIISTHEDKLQNAELTYSLLSRYLVNDLSRERLINELLVVFRLNSTKHSSNLIPIESNLSLIRNFFECIRNESDKFIEYQIFDDKIIFSLAEAIKIYQKIVPNERKRLDLLSIRKIFRSERTFVIEYGKVIKFKTTVSRCIIISYNQMNEEWKSIFSELISFEHST